MHKKLLGFFILIGLITTFYTLGASATYFPSVSSCPKGEFIAESGFADTTNCFPCDSISIRYTDQKNCAACPNRYMISDDGCVLKKCPKNHFVDNMGSCSDCSDDRTFSVRENTKAAISCLACLNRYITPNGYCAKKCDKNQFMDSQGYCSDCSDGAVHSIGSDPKAIASCTACPDRYITAGGKCAKKCDKNQFVDAGGNCWDCQSNDSIFIGTQSENIASCTACNPRKKAIKGYCSSPCEPNQLRAHSMCFSCDEELSLLDSSDCEACPNRYVTAGGECAKKCGKNQIADADGNCWDCSNGAALPIGSDPKAIAACLACPDRYINADGKCAKKEEARP